MKETLIAILAIMPWSLIVGYIGYRVLKRRKRGS
jgi:hypothetical protein